MTTKKLTFRQKILVAGTLFGMFFGAGNLIFPVHLGQMAGRNAVVAMIGFIITAVGIPIFGVAAIGITHSDGLQTLSSKVGKGYGIFFTCLLYLTIGPLFAIPRCATVSFTTGITPLLGADSPEWLYLLVFSAAFFAFVLFFSLRPGKITLWIGKIINPLFLFFFAVLIIAALLSPGAAISSVEPTEAYQNGSFFPALIEGYGTMDAIAGLAFGIVVIDITDEKNNLLVLVNPYIKSHTEELAEFEEGCLSLKGLYEKVSRPDGVTVCAQDLDGKPFEIEATGLLAVCLQHELDHLDGTVFIDHLSRLKKDRAKTKLRKLRKNDKQA